MQHCSLDSELQAPTTFLPDHDSEEELRAWLRRVRVDAEGELEEVGDLLRLLEGRVVDGQLQHGHCGDNAWMRSLYNRFPRR